VDFDFSLLRQIVRQRIEAGELPREPVTEKCWAGKGGGGLCAACDQPIQSYDNEYEIVLHEALAPAGSLLFHRTCLDIWIAESRRRAE
jgi:hypothetical protein